MEGFGQSLKRLRDAVDGELPEFAKLLQGLLVTNFEVCFCHVKTQKLLHKRRSSKWISGLESIMRNWTAAAPLKGKQKAQVSRHTAVCAAIQELFETVDKEASSLRIWQASTKDLLRALFASIEELSSKQLARQPREETWATDGLAAPKYGQLSHMELRTRCDYLTRIVNQISRIGIKEHSEIQLSPRDVEDALRVADLEESVLHILDCYTYKNFRISVEPKRLQMYGLKSQIEQSLTWSNLRVRSREMLDGQGLAHAIAEAEEIASLLIRRSESFSDFLESDDGVQTLDVFQPARKELSRILRRDTTDLIDLDLVLRTRSGTFRAGELLECWSVLFQIALCAQTWCRVSKKDSVAVLPITQVSCLVVRLLGCTPEQGECLVSQFSLDPSERNQDPFFRPLIRLDERETLIASAFIETGRFSRNLFTIAIRESRVDFSPKGLKPLKSIYKEFLDAGFRALLNFPIRAPQGTVTDVDIAAAKGGFLFIGQTKVLIETDTHYDDWKAHDSLRKAGDQLKRSLPYISLVRDRLGLADGEFLTVPFILTNVWGFTGAVVEGFKVIDFSYLSMLLRGAEIWDVRVGPAPTRELRKLIKGRYPTGEELSRLLLKPWHETMFRKPRLATDSFKIGDWTVTVPIDLEKLPTKDH
jgi:hypothetical protein